MSKKELAGLSVRCLFEAIEKFYDTDHQNYFNMFSKIKNKRIKQMKKIILSISLVFCIGFFFSACEKAAEITGTNPDGKTVNQDGSNYKDGHTYDMQPSMETMPSSAYKIVGDTVFIKKNTPADINGSSSASDYDGLFLSGSGYGAVHTRDGIKVRISDTHSSEPTYNDFITIATGIENWGYDNTSGTYYWWFKNSGFEFDRTFIWEDYRDASGNLIEVGLTKTFHYKVVDSLD